MEKRFDEKAKVNLKTYNVTTWEQTITIHILPNISTSKGNQTMKCGQLIQYTMRNIFLENHTQNAVQKLVLNSFLKHQN